MPLVVSGGNAYRFINKDSSNSFRECTSVGMMECPITQHSLAAFLAVFPDTVAWFHDLAAECGDTHAFRERLQTHDPTLFISAPPVVPTFRSPCDLVLIDIRRKSGRNTVRTPTSINTLQFAVNPETFLVSKLPILVSEGQNAAWEVHEDPLNQERILSFRLACPERQRGMG